MTFALSSASRARLAAVHPALRAVVERAINLTTVDFVVVQGNRTRDDQMRLYGQGRTVQQCAAVGVPAAYAQPGKAKVTWTLDSNHIGGRAVDLAPYVGGGIEWDNSGKLGLWPRIADAMRSAASDLKVPIVWGGDWVKTPDRPHFELLRGWNRPDFSNVVSGVTSTEDFAP